MRTNRLTSPGVLLIVATACAGGIFLLDQFVLRPYVARQRDSALREQAIQAEQTARAGLCARQDALVHACNAWARSPELRQAGPETLDEAFNELTAQALPAGLADCAWVTDADGNVAGFWSRAEDCDINATLSQIKCLDLASRPDGSGLVKLPHGAAIIACEPIGETSAPGRRPMLWFGSLIDAAMLERISAVVGGRVVLVPGTVLPHGLVGGTEEGRAFWSTENDALSVAWWMQDVAGARMGYMLANVPVTQIDRQATVARRTILIVLSLSVGLCVLVIVGVHILVSGPVIRLLKRLQQFESGDGPIDNLTRDLHGEPLVLARRLESAFEKLASVSKTDQLTGLSNRRHFAQVLEAFYYQARRYSRPLSLMVMDIDFFKAINDAGGHQAGDDLLKRIASVIESACRKADLPARLGGDEFAILLPETPTESAAGVAERIRQQVALQHVVVKGTHANVTVSIGVVDLNSGEITGPDTMMSLADRAAYAAKDRGRNRIVQAHELTAPSDQTAPEQAGRVDILSKKLIGLDTQFKDMFVQGLEEIMEILSHRDPHMAAHARKVQHYSVMIAHEMGLPDRVIKRLRIAAMLHDIGMLAMPDAILLSQNGLEDDQLHRMRQHPLLSVRIMEGMEFLEQEIPTVRYHHERFDGRGYPEGLAGAAIPLTARILTVADAFDAMTSPRIFRCAKSAEDALAEIRNASGSQFDPAVVDSLMAVWKRLGLVMLNVPGLKKLTDEADAQAQTPKHKADRITAAAETRPTLR